MIKSVQSCFTQYGLQDAISISARIYTSRGCLRSPYVNQTEDQDPNDIDKMPIQDGQIHHCGTTRCHGFQINQAYSQIQETNNYVHSVESSTQVKLTSKYRITKCKLRPTILQVLVERKQPSKTNGIDQHVSRFSIISCIQCIFSIVLTKVRLCQQNSVQGWSTSPIYWNNSNWRPSHTNSYSWHQCLMQESPQQSNKKHCFTNNKQNHSQIKPVFNFGSMAAIQSFTNYLAPPQTLSICQENQLGKQHGSTSSIFVEIKHQAQCQSKHTKTCKLRPRTRVQQMIRLMWNARTRTLKRFSLIHFKTQTNFIRGVQWSGKACFSIAPVLKKFKHKKKTKTTFYFLGSKQPALFHWAFGPFSTGKELNNHPPGFFSSNQVFQR